MTIGTVPGGSSLDVLEPPEIPARSGKRTHVVLWAGAASGVFRMDPMLGYPPGAPAGIPEQHSTAHRVHDIAGAVVFLSLPLAAAISAFTLSATSWRVASGCVAVALFLGLGQFGRAWEHVSPRIGLVQRAVIIPGWGWLAALFAALALGLS
ncbi:DUF998 domain-containing protein [Micromonospora maris]|uniref:DUF998 domain-containing protein n=1 Tax=Micromonospora maris TaxID=1003110 RepID=UPI002E14DCF8|nr:DUF998 domain-containing protein [Micromonospora maris]